MRTRTTPNHPSLATTSNAQMQRNFVPVQNPNVLPCASSSSSTTNFTTPAGTTSNNNATHNTMFTLRETVENPNERHVNKNAALDSRVQVMSTTNAHMRTGLNVNGGVTMASSNYGYNTTTYSSGVQGIQVPVSNQTMDMNTMHLNAAATSYVPGTRTNSFQQFPSVPAVPGVPATPTASTTTATTIAANLMLPQTHPMAMAATALAPTANAVVTQQLLTHAILSNWQQQQQNQQQQQAIVHTSAPQGTVVMLPPQVPMALPNIGSLSMGVPAVTVVANPLLSQTPTHPLSTPLVTQLQTQQLTGAPVQVSPALPTMMIAPQIHPAPTTTTSIPSIPNPPALAVQDLPLHQPIYNGINPNYPNLRVLHQHPPVFAVDDFLTQTECNFLISVAQDSFTAAPVVGKGAGQVSPSRTSTTCYLAREDLPLLLEKVTKLTGKPAQHCELPQVGRYLPSQQYLQHFDAFDLKNEDGRRFAANGGQRTVTVLIYLNDVTQGGHTSFPALNLDVQPKRGTALVFFPATVDGLLDKNALHAAKPAIDVKYVSQVWIRQGNYEGFPSKRMFTSAEQAAIVQKSLISAREGIDPSLFQG